ncbi:MAG: hypothetical protein QUU85_12045 [Candidatus Eisenbacteria bacterium]|nr:hypothetical protein [Candidatus Eisenbacteria bacterium]
MSRYRESDLSRIRSVPMQARGSLVREDALYRPPDDPTRFSDYWDSLPSILGAADLKSVVHAILASRAADRPVLALCGAHVLKTGLGPGLIRLLEEKLVTGIGFHGAGAVHDVELGLWGETSEDVASELHEGLFGMARETAALLNEAAREAAARQEGLGEAIGRTILETDRGAGSRSVLACAYRLGVPATVHVAIGTDVNHQHPDFDGAAFGAASARDFRILAAQVEGIAGGTVLNLGSAVILPEVFLKAFSVAKNLGAPSEGMTTAVFDFQRHYRPAENVVRRPTLGGGKGYYLIGQHEVLLPLLIQGCLFERARTAGPRASAEGGHAGEVPPAGEPPDAGAQGGAVQGSPAPGGSARPRSSPPGGTPPERNKS